MIRPAILALAVALSGCAAQAARQAVDDPAPRASMRPYDPAQEPWLRIAGDTVVRSLAVYAQTHDGKFPATALFPVALATYFPEADLPASPAWPDGVRQVQNVALTSLFAAPGASLTAIGTVLGPGRLPRTDADFDARTWGAWLYAADAGLDRYVLYGLGRSGDLAVVGYAAAFGP